MRYFWITVVCFTFVFGTNLVFQQLTRSNSALQLVSDASPEVASEYLLNHPWFKSDGAPDASPQDVLNRARNTALRAFVVFLGMVLALVLIGVWWLVHLKRSHKIELDKLSLTLEKQRQRTHESTAALVSLNDDLRLAQHASTRLSSELSVANSRLAQRNLEMERFVYTASHDLKAPLVSIGGHMQLLSQELSDEQHLHRLERVSVNVAFMERLLDDLLKLSRTIHQELDASRVRFGDVVDPIVDIFSQQIAKIEGEILVHGKDCEVYCNSRMLSQCLQNLVNNALKFRHGQRKLKIELSCKESMDGSIVRVQDNGIGITESNQTKVFELFESIGDGDGTGVGLAIVKSVMDKHGGEVLLSSTQGNGCEFELRFANK